MHDNAIGSVIRELRKKLRMTQIELAEKLSISEKTVSKWETNKGLPDISLIRPLAQVLGVSVDELIRGQYTCNQNISGNLLRSKFYVCPVCGNVIYAIGDAAINCCGMVLPPLEAEDTDDAHSVTIDPVEDEYYLTVHHSMTKEHYISFLAHVTTGGIQIVKLYPEGEAQARMQLRGKGYLYFYCNHHGLFRVKR